MENFTKLAVVFVAIFLVVKADPRYHRVEVHYEDDITAYQDIMVDEEKQCVVITVSKVTSNKVTPSINLYDFAAGFSVMKDVQHGICYISRTRHTMSLLLSGLKKAERNEGQFEATDTLLATSKKFVEKSDLGEYGELIESFCAEYELVFTEYAKIQRKKRALKMLTGTALACFICRKYV